MSASLLRQAASKRSACTIPTVLLVSRCYAAQAALAQTARSSDATESKRSSKAKKSLKDPWLPTGVELYLTEILKSGSDPTPYDIERCRPETHTQDLDSRRYAEEYNTLVDKLCRSFSRQQLRDFTILYGLDSRTSLTKTHYAESIIEKQWNWPSLKEAQKRLRDRTEVSVKTFPVNPVQLFLLLGRDGTEMLQMSKDYNIHIAVTRNPLALKVEGLRASLEAVSEHIDVVKEAIVEETLELPGGRSIKPDLIQPISRLADAYVDNFGGKDNIRICAKHERDLALAKRLVTRASLESQESSRTPLLSYLPACVSTPVPKALFPQKYAVYPFLSPRSLPWTMKSGGAFRVRRVFEWLGAADHENVQTSGGLAEGKGHIFDINQKELNLKDILCAELPDLRANAATKRVITASFGHMLLPPAATSQRTSIISPFNGFWSFTKILKWIEKSGPEATFVPSLPTQLINSTPTQQKFIIRLEYKVLSDLSQSPESQQHATNAQPTKFVKFEALLAHTRAAAHAPTPEHPKGEESVVDNNVTHPADLSNILENFQSDLESLQEQPPVDNGPLSHEAPSTEQQVESDTMTSTPGRDNSLTETNLDDSINFRCWAGVETAVNLILPDRPMDIRFVALDSMPVSRSQEPEELNAYASALHSYLRGGDQPDVPSPPNSFNYNEETYVLHKNCSVRQGTEPLFEVSPDNHNRAPEASAQVITESTLDMESRQKSALCEIWCQDHTSADDWKAFLRHCDRLSTVFYNSAAGKEEASSSDLDID